MTREEAIEYWNNHYEVGNVEQNEAVYMAIMALKRQKCENCKILELLVDFELETICEDDGKDFEYCENNCDFKAPTKECYLHWADMRKESE